MESMKIKIGESVYNIKQSFRALMIFEEITGKNINNANDSVTDILTMFYSLIKGNNKYFEFSFEQFVELVDDNPESVEAFTDYLNNLSKEQTPEQKPTKKKKA